MLEEKEIIKKRDYGQKALLIGYKKSIVNYYILAHQTWGFPNLHNSNQYTQKRLSEITRLTLLTKSKACRGKPVVTKSSCPPGISTGRKHTFPTRICFLLKTQLTNRWRDTLYILICKRLALSSDRWWLKMCDCICENDHDNKHFIGGTLLYLLEDKQNALESSCNEH